MTTLVQIHKNQQILANGILWLIKKNRDYRVPIGPRLKGIVKDLDALADADD